MRLQFSVFRAVAPFVACVLLAGCSSTTTTRRSPSPSDPFEAANRGAYAFNDAIDRAALRPVAKAYSEYLPGWFQKGVGNFFTNLQQPTTIVNQLLQGKPAKAASDLSRFAVNTVFGLGGLLDLASWDGIPLHDEDLGQTLGVWGVPKGPYLMVPLLGPTTARDLPSRFVDQFTRPLSWGGIAQEARWGSLALDLIDTRARLLPLDSTLESVYDPYAFIRDVYLQRVEFQVRDGGYGEDGDIDDPELQRMIDEAAAEDAADAASAADPVSEAEPDTAP